MLRAASLPLTRPSHPVRFLIVIGTRPEAIKLAPVVAELRARAIRAGRPDDVFVCVTGQHGAMVAEPLALFGITPDLDLNLMRAGQTLAALGARVLESLAEVLVILQPEWTIVQGDTATTAMAATAAFYAGIKVAHVEAGLRTHDLQNPFPEEANRRMVSIVSSMHFAATEAARRNLLREGILESAIKVTGNTGIDALRFHCDRLGISLRAPSMGGPAPKSTIDSQFAPGNPVRILVTAHRRENLESGIFDICHAIRALVDANPDRFHFVWPLHPNPKVADLARRHLAGLRDVTLTPAVGYDRLLALLSQCDIVLTDSGGLQEEAPSFGKQVLILREATERPEGVWAGIARLVGTDPARIKQALEETALQVEADGTCADPDAAPKPSTNPYGDGRAASRIADFFSNLPVHEFVYTRAPEAARLPNQSGSRPRSAVQIIQ